MVLVVVGRRFVDVGDHFRKRADLFNTSQAQPRLQISGVLRAGQRQESISADRHLPGLFVYPDRRIARNVPGGGMPVQ